MTPKKTCFVIMPFGEEGTSEYERNLKIYRQMIKPVVEACGYNSIRADELEHLGSITRDIIELLQKADLVIADLSGRNANVYYELGVRHTLFRCGTIPIIRKGEKLPFDISNYRAIFYSIEIDGPDKLKRKLTKRIQAVEKLKRKKSDNPVHDILGDLLSQDDSDAKKLLEQQLQTQLQKFKKISALHETVVSQHQVTQKELKTALQANVKIQNQATKLERQVANLKKKLAPSPEAKRMKPLFRSQPQELSSDEVKAMLKAKNFYDINKNKTGTGFKNQFEENQVKGDKIITDRASGLAWQQSGSQKRMTFEAAQKWIKDLNEKSYAGYQDWRLPTLEEAMSLMESEKNSAGLYVDARLDKTQRWIWTADIVKGESWAWVVIFDRGGCDYVHFYYDDHVRGVRFRHSLGSDLIIWSFELFNYFLGSRRLQNFF